MKAIITNQGPNFIEAAIQRAARSVTTLQAVIAKFDQQSNVPPISNSRSTKSLEQDVAKVLSTVLKEEILLVKSGIKHSSYPTLRTNPLWNWDLSKTEKWIESYKKQYYYKYKGTVMEPEVYFYEMKELNIIFEIFLYAYHNDEKIIYYTSVVLVAQISQHFEGTNPGFAQIGSK